MSQFKTTLTNDSNFNKIDYNNLGFGKYFSDHIYISEYKNGEWSRGEIKAYEPMLVEPGMCTLHYGQTIFEGLKAYRDFENGGVNIFRPDMNATRMASSAERVCIPPFPEKQFVEACSELVKIDAKFIPEKEGQSLYIRPVCYGDGNFLGVHQSDTYKFIIMTSPVASYYEAGLKPVDILVSHEFARTVEGGLGMAKTAANYAASLLAGQKAKEKGFAQVLWLDGIHRKFIDEVGAMNIMFVIDDVLITPPLDSGTILPGITRDTVLQLAMEMNMEVEEKRLTIDDIIRASKRKTLQEVFGTGTAAIVSPVGLLNYKGQEIIINKKEIGPIASKFYDIITGLQHGNIDDTFGWNLHLEQKVTNSVLV